MNRKNIVPILVVVIIIVRFVVYSLAIKKTPQFYTADL